MICSCKFCQLCWWDVLYFFTNFVAVLWSKFPETNRSKQAGWIPHWWPFEVRLPTFMKQVLRESSYRTWSCQILTWLGVDESRSGYRMLIASYSSFTNIFSSGWFRMHMTIISRYDVPVRLTGADFWVGAERRFFGFPDLFSCPTGSPCPTWPEVVALSLSSWPETVRLLLRCCMLTAGFDFSWPSLEEVAWPLHAGSSRVVFVWWNDGLAYVFVVCTALWFDVWPEYLLNIYPVCWLDIWPAYWLTIWPAYWFGIWPAYWLTIWPAYWFGIWPAYWLDIWPAYWLAIWPAYWLDIWPAYWLTIWPVCLSSM